MPLFVCSDCKCIENTACCGFWYRDRDKPPLCSKCDPAIGKWHGAFPRDKASEEQLAQADPDTGRI